MKKLTIYINSCRMCPYWEHLKSQRREANCCDHSGLRAIPNIRDQIPEWCQLEEVK